MPYQCTKFEGNRWRTSMFFLVQRYCVKSVRRRKMWRKLGNFQKHISHKLLSRFSLNLLCKVVYMGCIKYVNWIEIGPVVIEIWGVENGDLAVPVNKTLVCHMTSLAADTRPCVLILSFGNNYKLLTFRWRVALQFLITPHSSVSI